MRELTTREIEGVSGGFGTITIYPGHSFQGSGYLFVLDGGEFDGRTILVAEDGQDATDFMNDIVVTAHKAMYDLDWNDIYSYVMNNNGLIGGDTSGLGISAVPIANTVLSADQYTEHPSAHALDLRNNPIISAAIAKSITDSNAGPHPLSQITESGFDAYANPSGDIVVIAKEVIPSPDGIRDGMTDPAAPPAGYSLVFDFHTHPFSVNQSSDLRPDTSDLASLITANSQYNSKAVGAIWNVDLNSIEYYGPNSGSKAGG